ncbi:MAG: D-2-hydroxyacid dehydrogenase [Phycisphaerae bacterium]|nr:D-2-hydroxyacid dehydrogenase [Phycisphaerae bacterium]
MDIPARRVHVGLAPLVLLAALATAGAPPSTPAPPTAATPTPDAESIGSLRNARVAFPIEPGAPRPGLTLLTGPLTDAQLAELRAAAPNVRIEANLTREQALARAPEAHAADARFATAEFIARAPNLVWVQATSAGVDRFLALDPLMKSDRIVLTNMRAVHGPAIADHAFAMLLTLTRNLRVFEAHRGAGRWSDEPPAGTPEPIALQGRTMLVVGIGGIGSEIAQRAHGFGMRVLATRRTDAPAPDYIARVGRPEDLTSMLPEADVVALCVPLTPETERLFDPGHFAAMKPGAYLINIARGRVVDTGALLAALDSGRLAGACLDVTDPEPLPTGHPLWTRPNVIITPHVAADADLTRRRHWSLFKENVRRFGVGEPLMNTVDKKAGY